MPSNVIFFLNMEIIISLSMQIKIRIVDENAKQVLKNLSALAKWNIRMAC